MANFKAALVIAFICGLTGLTNAQFGNSTRDGDCGKYKDCVVPVPKEYCSSNKGSLINIQFIAPCSTFNVFPESVQVALAQVVGTCTDNNQICSQCKGLTVDLVAELEVILGTLGFNQFKKGVKESSCCSSKNGKACCSQYDVKNSPCAKQCKGRGSCANGGGRKEQCCSFKCVS